MRFVDWKDYELIDATQGNRLEKWGNIILIRPDPQIIWKTNKKSPLWEKAHAIYHRSKSGGGKWEILRKMPETFNVNYKELKFNLKLMGFKHTGVFPEQAVNWDFIISKIKEEKRPLKVLNLFAYTGGATLAAASAGAEVCHVDASKGMIALARENAKISNLDKKPIRWIVDDCIKFVEREIRRKNKYDGIILDPPSYGRGPNGEVWQLEDKLFDFMEKCNELLSKDAKFIILNSYTTGLSPAVMGYLLGVTVAKDKKGKILSSEIGIKVSSTDFILPSGSTAIWSNDNKLNF